MIDHNTEGILIEQRDVQGLAEALIRLGQNPEERRRLGVAARTRAVDAFDVRLTARRVLEAIGSNSGLASGWWENEAVVGYIG